MSRQCSEGLTTIQLQFPYHFGPGRSPLPSIKNTPGGDFAFPQEMSKFVTQAFNHMAKALERELLQYIFQLDEAEKKSVLQMLKTFLKGREKKFPRITIDQYNKEIDEAIARVEAGDYYTQEEAERMAKEW
jgi:hypothetical protein